MSNKALAIASILFSLLILEAGLWLAVKVGAMNFDAPSYSLRQVVPFWRDLNSDFGVWHPAHHVYRHRKACIDIEYRSNAFGARDVERQAQGDTHRAVILGDSFVEGYGVEQENRFSDILEQVTGLEHLNFGTSGNFGPTQYLLLYKTMAKQYTHDLVIVGILPDNDFINDDYELGKKNHKDQYRPYWLNTNSDWQLAYYQSSLGDLSFKLVFKYVRGFLREFTYTYPGLEYFNKVLNYKQSLNESDAKAQSHTSASSYSGYYDFTERQWNVMAHNLTLLAQEAAGKNLLIVTIPRHGDFLRQISQGGQAPLQTKMRELANKLNIGYLDLMPAMMTQDWSSFFLSCDPHWSSRGHAEAATLIKASEYYRNWLATDKINQKSIN